MRILLLTDGSENSLRAARHAVALARGNPRVEVQVLNVQEPVDGRVRAYFSKKEIDKIELEAGRAALAPAEKLLNEAGIPHRASVRVGSIPEAIAQYVADEQCGAIVMGTRGMSAIGNLLLGASATKVIHAVHVPVTLVR